jgi:hypothetical protein
VPHHGCVKANSFPTTTISVALLFLVSMLALAAGPGLAHEHDSARRAAATAAASTQDGAIEELEGVLDVVHEDRATGGRYVYFLSTDAGERLALEGISEPRNLKTGDRVRVKALKLGKTAWLSVSGGTLQTVRLAPPSNTFGAQRTLVILINFQDNPTRPYTVDAVRNVVATTSNFYRENSYGQTWLTADVVGWYTIPLNAATTPAQCDGMVDRIATYARSAAAAAGANLSSYTRFVYGFPGNSCDWWGRATIGGNPSHAWINGSFQFRVLGHEMGHALGLYHSHALDCGSAVIGGSCGTIEYGDTIDIMGSAAGHFNAFQKERLGWLNYGVSPPITTVESEGTYTIDPFETPANGNPKALKILKSSSTWYYVEFRRPVGFDSFISSNSNVLNGVVIHTGSYSSPDASYLLDMTAATLSWTDPALTVGQSFTDRTSGVTITTVWVNTTSAGVAVAFGSGGSGSCVRANPTVIVSPSSSPAVPAGTTVSYAVTVQNNDSAACPPSSFALQVSAPTGWSLGAALSSLSLSPAATASTAVQVTSAASAASGAYPITVNATNSADPTYAASTAATYQVSVFSVKASTNQSTYTRPANAYVTVRVANGTSPMDVNLKITVTRPDGVKTVRTPRTGSDGSVRFRVRLGSSAPPGTYAVEAVASADGLVLGSGITSFTVR